MEPSKAAAIFTASNDIQGWFSYEAAMLFALLDEVQKQQGIVGGLFEIGVHHGKSAALIGAMARPGREFFAVCDVFEQQNANASGSGEGNRDIFERNMRRLVVGELDLRVHAKLSSDLDKGQIGNGYRFFHIDGGHNASEALGDLRLAAEVLCDAGVIVVDDPFRPEWPGVTEAVIRFLDSDPRFAAIVVGFNKLVLVRTENAVCYTKEIDRTDQRSAYGWSIPWQLKELTFLNAPLRIFYVPTSFRHHDNLLTRLKKVFKP